MAMNFAEGCELAQNQKTAGDSETASDVEVAGFAAGLLLTDFDNMGRSV
jgi:hypothetical protein